MSGGAGATKLTALLNKLRAAEAKRAEQAGPAPAQATLELTTDPIVNELVRSILIEDAPAERAAQAVAGLCAVYVDGNELRVSTVDEIAAALGRTIPAPAARAVRLKETLREVYQREHTLSLARLESLPKREAAAYLSAITSPFAAQRTALVALGVHQLPADGRLVAALAASGILNAGGGAPEATAMLNKAIRPAEGPEAHRLLHEWAAGLSPAPRAQRESRGAHGEATAREGRSKQPARPRATGAKAGRAR